MPEAKAFYINSCDFFLCRQLLMFFPRCCVQITQVEANSCLTFHQSQRVWSTGKTPQSFSFWFTLISHSIWILSLLVGRLLKVHAWTTSSPFKHPMPSNTSVLILSMNFFSLQVLLKWFGFADIYKCFCMSFINVISALVSRCTDINR